MKRRKINFMTILGIMLLVWGFFILSSCATDNELALMQREMGLTEAQTVAIEEKFEIKNIEPYKISKSENLLINNLHEDWVSYDVFCINSNVYLLILRRFDYDFAAIIDSDNMLIYGMIDSNMLPETFHMITQWIPGY